MGGSLWTIWEQTAAAAPDRLAVIDANGGRPYTRRELLNEAALLAHGDVRPGEIVAFAEPNGVCWAALFLAAQKLGAGALPLDAAMPADHQPAAATALGAHWLVSGEQWRRLDRSAVAPGCCVVKTTSGTTGQPKPIHATAENMVADARNIISTMGIGADDVNLGAVPFGHSYGLGNLVLPLILQGTVIACSTEMLPGAIAAQIERCGATVFPSAPAIFRALAESSIAAGQLRTLRRVISAGAALPSLVASSFRKRFGLAVHNFYGSSETGGICFDRSGEAGASGRSVGTPLEGVEVEIAEDGRVTVRSAAVIGGGMHALPDLGRWNAEGELVLTGRLTPLANIGGKKVAPQEIENTLRTFEGVTDAWVGMSTRTGIGGGDYLLAAVETRRSREEVMRELATRLPAWQIPRRLWTAASFPRTARGKLDRAALEARLLARPATPGNATD